MSSTNKTTYYELSQYVGSDKPTYLGDYNSDMLKIDTGLHAAADAADIAVTTANAANSAATSASTTASTALSTAQTASTTATQAQTTAETALTNSGAAQSAAEEAETAAKANVITNLAPAYDSSLTYSVGELVTYIDAQGSGKLYKCIVAVETPETFNINKWDDVTTSEVYSTKCIRVTYTASNITLNTAFMAINDILKRYKDLVDIERTMIEFGSGNYNTVFMFTNHNITQTNEELFTFHRVNENGTNTYVFSDASGYSKIVSNNFTTSGVTTTTSNPTDMITETYRIILFYK